MESNYIIEFKLLDKTFIKKPIDLTKPISDDMLPCTIYNKNHARDKIYIYDRNLFYVPYNQMSNELFDFCTRNGLMEMNLFSYGKLKDAGRQS